MRFLYLLLLSLVACGQSPRPLTATASSATAERCEGCEAVYESPVPLASLPSTDTLPDYADPGPKLVISGTVYQPDGRTPAPGVVLYVYHTNQQGVYPTIGGENGWARRHGRLRGWVRTDANGRYAFYTLRPAPYSKDGPPAHIHLTVKEPERTEYWMDDYLFDDDPLLTTAERQRQPARGGSGIVRTVTRNGVQYAQRNLVLGRNVPGYSQRRSGTPVSGLAVGEDCPAFDPLHVSGADAGTTACPICKYGYGQGLMWWFRAEELPKLKAAAQSLEAAMQTRGEARLRVFLVSMGGDGSQLKAWAKEAGLRKVALVRVPSATDAETSKVFRINPSAANTVMVYKRRQVVRNEVNSGYSAEAVTDLLTALR